jgi:hypothetical protein
MNNLGYIHSGGDPKRLGDVLTWHDQQGFRVWIHSKAMESAREIVSVEVQVIDEGALKPSKEEQSLRLRLCANRSTPKSVGKFKATTFRTLQTGQLLDEHSSLVARIINQSSKSKNKLQIVEEVTSKTVDLRESLVWDSSDEMVSQGKKSKDAIIIAKIYEMLQSSGTRKLSARTAELLGLEVSTVHTAVQVARRNGWLTSNGVGLSGGVLTEKGNEMFLAVRGPERLARIMKKNGE